MDDQMNAAAPEEVVETPVEETVEAAPAAEGETPAEETTEEAAA